jgi:hypothetical protein
MSSSLQAEMEKGVLQRNAQNFDRSQHSTTFTGTIDFLDALDIQLYNKPIMTLRVHPLVAEVARAQSDIGWHQILNGRFAKEWKQAQNAYLGTRANKRNNGDTWMTSVITTWFQQWLKLWKLRKIDMGETRLQSARHRSVTPSGRCNCSMPTTKIE